VALRPIGRQVFPSISGARRQVFFPKLRPTNAGPALTPRITGNQVVIKSVGLRAGVRQFIAGTRRFRRPDGETQGPKFHLFAAPVNGPLCRFRCWAATSTRRLQQPDCPNLKSSRKAQLRRYLLGQDQPSWSALAWPQASINRGPTAPMAPATTLRLHQLLSCFLAGWEEKSGAGQKQWTLAGPRLAPKAMKAWLALNPNTPRPNRYVNQAFVRGVIPAGGPWRTRKGQFVLGSLRRAEAAGLNGVTLDERLGGEECNPSEWPKASPIVAFTLDPPPTKTAEKPRPMRVRAFLQLVVQEDHSRWRRSWARAPQGRPSGAAKAEGGKIKN